MESLQTNLSVQNRTIPTCAVHLLKTRGYMPICDAYGIETDQGSEEMPQLAAPQEGSPVTSDPDQAKNPQHLSVPSIYISKHLRYGSFAEHRFTTYLTPPGPHLHPCKAA